MLPLFLTSHKAYFGVLAALFAVGFALCLWFSKQQASLPLLGDYHVYHCETGGSGNGSFNLLTVSSIFAREIADNLCRAPVVAGNYKTVSISWKPRQRLTAEEVLNEDYDLIWSREHSLRGLVPEYSSYYESLLRYDQYKVFWFSRNDQPQLTREYFRDKKIGLLNDRLSHTFHLLPLASLKQLGVDISRQSLIYFDDASSLYRAFAQGDLDLVSGGLFLEQDLDIPLQRMLIADNVVAATLFVRKARPPEIDCAIARAFDDATAGYFSAHRDFPGAAQCGG